MLVSLAGLIGACCRVNWLLWVYLLVMFLLIAILFCFTIFAFVVTNKGAGETVSKRGYKEYKLGDYSNWLQKRVDNPKNWRRIRSCLVDGKICQKLAATNSPQTVFFSKHLSPIEVYYYFFVFKFFLEFQIWVLDYFVFDASFMFWVS